jgi:phage terminase small subunit
MLSSRIAQLRALGSELGLDTSARRRVGGGNGGEKKDPAGRFFK